MRVVRSLRVTFLLLFFTFFFSREGGEGVPRDRFLRNS